MNVVKSVLASLMMAQIMYILGGNLLLWFTIPKNHALGPGGMAGLRMHPFPLVLAVVSFVVLLLVFLHYR